MPKPFRRESDPLEPIRPSRLRMLALAGASVLALSVVVLSTTSVASFADEGLMTLVQQDDDDDDDDDDGGGGDDDGGAGGGGGDDGGAGGGGGDDGGTGGGGDDDGGGGGGNDSGAGGGDDDGAGRAGDDNGAGRRTGGGDNEDDTSGAPREETGPEGFDFRDEQGFRARSGQVLLINPTPASLQLSQSLGFRVIRTIRLPDLGLTATVLRIPRNLQTREALRRLRQRDRTGLYDYNHLYDFRPTVEQRMPYYRGAEEAPRRPLSQSRDVAIGLVDTGVYNRHPILQDARIEQKAFHYAGPAAKLDHGTAVVSVLADRRDGLLPNGRFYIAGVFGVAPQGDPVSSVVELASAINWLADENVAVINMSLAGPPNALLEAAVARAIAKGHVIVAAVGNAGPRAKPLFPAAYPGVIGVTATDVRQSIFRRALQGPQVDFAAPGVSVRGANGTDAGESLFSGTSFASPYIAAFVALGLKRPNPSQAALAYQGLIPKARDLGQPGRDPIFGFGLLQP